jgi:peptide alpha-N-acetyltransferase
MRDYHGYIQSRRLMLQAKPVLRQNWTALAVAQHLAGELVSAEQTLKTYEGTLKQPPPSADFEHSEAQLYRSMIIEESGDTDRALEHLESIAKANLDRVAVMEARARILLKLNRLDEAEQAYRALLERNNEYRLYYECLEKACGLERSRKEDVPKLVELYDSFIRGNDRVDAPRRIPLDFLEGLPIQSSLTIDF